MKETVDFIEVFPVAPPNTNTRIEGVCCSKCGFVGTKDYFVRVLSVAQSRAVSRGRSTALRKTISSLCKKCQPKPKTFMKMSAAELEHAVRAHNIPPVGVKARKAQIKAERLAEQKKESERMWFTMRTQHVFRAITKEISILEGRRLYAVKVWGETSPVARFFLACSDAMRLCRLRITPSFVAGYRGPIPHWIVFVPADTLANLRKLHAQVPLEQRSLCARRPTLLRVDPLNPPEIHPTHPSYVKYLANRKAAEQRAAAVGATDEGE